LIFGLVDENKVSSTGLKNVIIEAEAEFTLILEVLFLSSSEKKESSQLRNQSASFAETEKL